MTGLPPLKVESDSEDDMYLSQNVGYDPLADNPLKSGQVFELESGEYYDIRRRGPNEVVSVERYRCTARPSRKTHGGFDFILEQMPTPTQSRQKSVIGVTNTSWQRYPGAQRPRTTWTTSSQNTISYQHPNTGQPTSQQVQYRAALTAGGKNASEMQMSGEPESSMSKRDNDESEANEDGYEEAEAANWKHKARQYQLDLYRAARRSNIIAFLDTGAGKTFISVLLIRDMSSQADHDAKIHGTDRKTIFFLVPSKVLVQQQAQVLRKYTDLEVSEHTGDRKNEDTWDAATWMHHVSNAHVLVMTPQLLLNMLRQQVLMISHIKLLVFDECHHARGNMPYNAIMKSFYYPAKERKEPVPKIFGMTASLGAKKSDVNAITDSVNELEENLNCSIMTSTRDDIKQFSTSAQEVIVQYSSSERQNIVNLSVTDHLMNRALTRLNVCNQLCRSDKMRSDQHSGKSWRVDNKKSKGPLEQQIRHIGNVQFVLSVMGLLPASWAVWEVAHGWYSVRNMKKSGNLGGAHKHGYSEQLPKEFTDQYEKFQELRREDLRNPKQCLEQSLQDMLIGVICGLFQFDENQGRKKVQSLTSNKTALTTHDVKAVLREIRKELDFSKVTALISSAYKDSYATSSTDSAVAILYSDKMQKLFHVLSGLHKSISPEEMKEWRGMIFVQQTLIALVLENTMSLHEKDLNFYRCQSLTGHNAAIQAASMEDHHQRRVIRGFRSGKYNLLLCTSVAEEGLDITHCSMVMRFDLPSTDASYIQSRGRARKPGAYYYMFLDQDDQGERVRIEDLKKAELCMKEYAINRQKLEQSEAAADEDITSGTEDARNEMQNEEKDALSFDRPLPTESEGKDIAVEMIHKYVTLLPQDEYCRLSPHLIFRCDEINGCKQYQYKLTLPLNAAFSRPVFGDYCASKQKAKSSACYKACVTLREMGHLNERFYPTSQKDRFATRRSKGVKLVPELLNSFASLDPLILRTDHAKMMTEAEYMGKMPPPGFQGPQKLRLHLLIVEIQNAPKSIMPRFGIVTFERLDHLTKFKLFKEQRVMTVNFSYGGDFLITDSDLNKLKKYHMTIMEPLYFRSKLFSKISILASQDFCTLLDSGFTFFPDELKPFKESILNMNQSWYLLAPLIQQQFSKCRRNEGIDPLDPLSSSHLQSFDDEDDNPSNLIDWKTIDILSFRLKNLHQPGLDITKTKLGAGDVVYTPYNSNTYRVVGIRNDLNLESPFPSKPNPEFYHSSVTKEYRPSYIPNRVVKEFSSFSEYYKEQWNKYDLIIHQPLLECVPIKHFSIVKRAKNLLNPVAAQQGETDNSEDSTIFDFWNQAVHIVPELSVVYPLNFSLWESLPYVAATCWKLESMLKVLELRSVLFQESHPYPSIPMLDVEFLMESVTCRSCHEESNYERLEFIGDAVLKYIVSLYCFFKLPFAHEGILTTDRSDFICNRHLAEVALTSGLQNYIRSVQIGEHPWRPAGCQFLDGYWLKCGFKIKDGASWFGGRTKKFSFENEKHQSKVVALKFKQVADVVEALIGSCFIHKGIPFACALIDRLGILDSSPSFICSVNSRSEHAAWLKRVQEGEDSEARLEVLENYEKLCQRQFQHGRSIHSLENAIGYKFKAAGFAQEAMTHCSWAHSDPPCYQRLEYLGDAVLDFMISVYYYKSYENSDPGTLTALRSASVNNDKLATNAVKLDLYRYLMHFSSILQGHITEYVTRLEFEQDISDSDKGAPKVLGDVVESLIGAVYLDVYGDVYKTWEIWRPLLEPYYAPNSIPTHPIVQLLTICQRNGSKCDFVTTKKRAVNLGTSVHGGEDGLNSATMAQSTAESEEDVNISEDSESDYGESEAEFKEELSGKRGLRKGESSSRTIDKIIVRVVIDGETYAESSGNHLKTAKKQAAIEALKELMPEKEEFVQS